MPLASPGSAGTVSGVLDLRRLRAEPDTVKAAVARRGEPTAPLDQVLVHDERRRAVVSEADELRGEVKRISAEVGALHRDGRTDEAEDLRARSRELGGRIDELAAEADQLSEWIRRILLFVPNMPAEGCPDGSGPDDNVVVRMAGYDPDSYGEHQRVPHWDIGTELGILDVDRAVRMSGAMFAMYRGLGARMVRALIDYGARPQSRPVRGDPATHAGAHRDHDQHRPSAQVLRRRLSPRARRPVGHSHRRGAAHIAAVG